MWHVSWSIFNFFSLQKHIFVISTVKMRLCVKHFLNSFLHLFRFSYSQTFYGKSLLAECRTGTSSGTSLPGTWGDPAARRHLAEEWGGRRTEKGRQQLDRQQRGTFARRSGPSGRHGQLYLRVGKCGRQADQRHGRSHRFRYVPLDPWGYDVGNIKNWLDM